MTPQYLTLLISFLLTGCVSTHFISADANKPIDLPDTGLPMATGSTALIGHFSNAVFGHTDLYYERGVPTGSPRDRRRDIEYLVARTNAGIGFRHQIEPKHMVGAGLTGSLMESRYQTGSGAVVDRLTVYIENSIYPEQIAHAAVSVSFHALVAASLVTHQFTLYTRDSFFAPITVNPEIGTEPRLIHELFAETPLHFPVGPSFALSFAPQFRFIFSQSILHQRVGFLMSAIAYPNNRLRIQTGYGFISRSWVIGDYWGGLISQDSRRSDSSPFHNLNVTVQYLLKP